MLIVIFRVDQAFRRQRSCVAVCLCVVTKAPFSSFFTLVVHKTHVRYKFSELAPNCIIASNDRYDKCESDQRSPKTSKDSLVGLLETHFTFRSCMRVNRFLTILIACI